LFIKANGESAGEARDTLAAYCRASGQRINLDKSSIFFSKRCPGHIKDELKQILNVQNESLTEKYLGMPSSVGRSINGAFKFLKDRIWKRVQGWIEQCLSAGGKDILIKSVVQAIPIFSMACFKLPRGLCQHINSMIGRFWWGSKDGKRKMSWVSWEEMTKPKYMGGLGFRDIELFNLALLARQGWRILTNPDTLSAKILKAVYYPTSDFLTAELGSHPSQVWRAIMEGRETLAQGLIRRIGTGENTYAWDDNWIPRDGALRPFASRMAHPPPKVCDFMDQTARQWDEEKLNTWFFPLDVEVIKTIPISTRTQDDFWAWHYDRKGMFTVRSAYKMLVSTKERREAWLDETAANSDQQGRQNSWAKLWHIQVPSKLRIFLWRLAKHSLPTADTLHRRHISPSSACAICGAEDSWRHSLLDCTMSRCVWALTDDELTEHMSHVQEPAARNWLFTMFETVPKEQLTRMCVTAWAIWHARRKAIHEGIFQSPLSTHHFVENFLADLSQSQNTVVKGGAAQKRDHPRWIPSPVGVAKVNVDAAVSRRQDHGVIAAVARRADGEYLGASAVLLHGMSDPEVLEALAVREGTNLALDLSLQRIRVASDCLSVVNAMKEQNRGRYSHILHEIMAASVAFTDFSLVYESRCSNNEPHALARSILGSPAGRYVWFGTPPAGVCIPQLLMI
jgi:hypothetical protein